MKTPQYAVLVYNFDNSDIFDKTIEFQINDQFFVVEMILMEICGKTITYATHKKREGTRLEKQLNEEIRILENNIDANNVTLWSRHQTVG